MATTILKRILTSTEEIDGVRYFNGEDAILLAAAVSDFGRDYMISVPTASGDSFQDVKLGTAIAALYSGELKPGPELEDRLQILERDFPNLAARAVEKFNGTGGFEYFEPRDGEEKSSFSPFGARADLPEKYIGRLGAAHHSTLRKMLKEGLATPGFVGEVGGRLNGLELRFFDSQWFSPRGRNAYDSGFYFYYFMDTEGHLLAWKTGISVDFKRGGTYTLVGGSVKAHDSYPGQQPKTLLTRAKFFDNEAGDML